MHQRGGMHQFYGNAHRQQVIQIVIETPSGKQGKRRPHAFAGLAQDVVKLFGKPCVVDNTDGF